MLKGLDLKNKQNQARIRANAKELKSKAYAKRKEVMRKKASDKLAKST